MIMERKVFEPEVDLDDLFDSDDWRWPDDLEDYDLYHQREQFQAEIWRLEDLLEEKQKEIDKLKEICNHGSSTRLGR